MNQIPNKIEEVKQENIPSLKPEAEQVIQERSEVPAEKMESKVEIEGKVVKTKKFNILLAIIPLVVLVIIGGLLFYYFKTKNTGNEKEVTVLPTPKPFFLTVDNLNNEVTTINGELLVKGKTLENTSVAIYTDIDEVIVESDGEGYFEESVVVGKEGGLVRVTVFNENGEEKEVTFNVVEQEDILGTKDKKESQGKSDDKKNTNTSQSNKDKEKEDKSQKLTNTEAKNVKTQTGQNVIIDEKKKTDKEVRVQEKADFLANKLDIKQEKKLGANNLLKLLNQFTDSSESGKVKTKYNFKKMETVEASSGAQLKRHALSGIITNISGNKITISHQTQQDRQWYIYYNESTTITGKADSEAEDIEASGSADGTSLKVGARVTAVGITNDDGILATRIHIIPGKAIGVYKKFKVATESANPTSPSEASESAETEPEESPTSAESAEVEE